MIGGVSKEGLCEKLAIELRLDARNQLWHSGEGCVSGKSSRHKGGNETGIAEGLKGGQCGWTKGGGGECDGRWDWESGTGLAGYGRSLGFILSATGSHLRVLNRPNLNHFNSTKVPSFHIEVYLYHLLVVFNFNRQKHLKSQTVKLVTDYILLKSQSLL